ncbi:hypothetical protein [Streptomyces sp. N35]|uniref:hypothetical protein n=1 Tax=Streptomyces sp. N35 TaxID=2795730 RepID=UPI0018F70F27|nr:hypothetical protein [Streptomyces sp. N35]
MTHAATLPPAVRRLMRPTAVRRGLQLLLLLGAFLVLGLLCGERAGAAEQDTDPVASAVSVTQTATDPLRETVSEPVREVSEPVRETVSAPVRGAAEPVRGAAEPVQETVTEPVRQVAETTREVTAPVRDAAAPVREVGDSTREAAAPVREAAEPVREAAEPLREAAAPAREAAEPVRDITAPVREVAAPVREVMAPVRSVVRSVQEPVQQLTLPVADGVGRTVEAVTGLLEPVGLPQPGLPYVPWPAGPGDAEGAQGQDPSASASAPAGTADQTRPDAAHRPAFAGTDGNTGQAAGPSAHPVAQLPLPELPSGPAHLPAPGAPQGLGAHSTAESSTQRHGDAQPATLPDGHLGVPLSGGKGASTSYDRIRDRHRDILEFPG